MDCVGLLGAVCLPNGATHFAAVISVLPIFGGTVSGLGCCGEVNGLSRFSCAFLGFPHLPVPFIVWAACFALRFLFLGIFLFFFWQLPCLACIYFWQVLFLAIFGL